jgi:hypothetical protein
MKLFQFQFGKDAVNESQHTYQGITVYSYIVYVTTDAPPGSPVLGSFTNSGRPVAVTGCNVTPWGDTQLLVEINTLEQLASGDAFNVTILQEGASTYGPVTYPKPTK